MATKATGTKKTKTGATRAKATGTTKPRAKKAVTKRTSVSRPRQQQSQQNDMFAPMMGMMGMGIGLAMMDSFLD